MQSLAQLKRLRRSFEQWCRRDEGGVAVEAVIVLPVLAAFYCASFVWFDAYRQRNLAMKSSYAVSDVLSRVSEVDNDFLDDLLDVLDYMIPSNERPIMRVTFIEYDKFSDETNKHRVTWSYGADGVTKMTQDDLDKDMSWLPVMGDYEAVVVTETGVLHEPIFNVGIPKQMYRNTIVTRPRFDTKLKNVDFPDVVYAVGSVDVYGDEDPSGNGVLLDNNTTVTSGHSG